MGKLATIILATTAVVAGAYSYYWVEQSHNFKNNLEQSIHDFNEQAKLLNNNKPLIRYASLDISGFPFSLQANFHKLVLDSPISGIVAQIQRKEKSSENNQNISVQVEYGDTISLASNIMMNDFALTVTGDQSIRPIINNEVRPALIGSSQNPFICHLKIANQNNMPWNFPKAFSDATSFMNAFRRFTCDVSGAASRYGDSPEIISSVEKFAIAVSMEPETSLKRKIGLHVSVENAKSSAAYDQIANSYLQLAYQIMETPAKERGYVINSVQYGAQNSTIDMHYEGPVEKQSFADPALSAVLDINAFDLKNDLYTTQNKAHFSLVPSPDNTIALAVSAHSLSNFSEQFETAMAQHIALMFNQLSDDPSMPFIHEIVAQGKTAQVANAIVPKLHNMGTVLFDADITAKANRNIMQGGVITISSLDLTTAKYGVKLSGNGSSNPTAGDLRITCLSCDAMVNDIGDYAIALDNALSAFRQPPMLYVSKPLVEGVDKFLHGINEYEADKNTKDMLIHIIADAKSNITISGKQIMEVVGLIGTNITPYLQPHPVPDISAVPQPVTAIPPAATQPIVDVPAVTQSVTITPAAVPQSITDVPVVTQPVTDVPAAR